MNWIKAAKDNKIKPPPFRPIICYCPEWNCSGYQIAQWNTKEFEYEEQPNDMFSDLVEEWALFMEAD